MFQKKKKKSNKGKHYNWVVTPDTYLATALLLCKKIPRSLPYDNVVCESVICSELAFESSHPDYEFIYSIVYNFKHGIELYLKGLGCCSHEEYSVIHDLRELFDNLIGNARTKKNQLLFQGLKEDTWPTIKKYYFGTYIPHIETEGRPDTLNEAERYPETEFAYDPKDPYLWVKNNVIDQLEVDIKLVEIKFAKVLREIDIVS